MPVWERVFWIRKKCQRPEFEKSENGVFLSVIVLHCNHKKCDLPIINKSVLCGRKLLFCACDAMRIPNTGVLFIFRMTTTWWSVNVVSLYLVLGTIKAWICGQQDGTSVWVWVLLLLKYS